MGELFILQLIMSKETLSGSFPASLSQKRDVSLDTQTYFAPNTVCAPLIHCS